MPAGCGSHPPGQHGCSRGVTKPPRIAKSNRSCAPNTGLQRHADSLAHIVQWQNGQVDPAQQLEQSYARGDIPAARYHILRGMLQDATGSGHKSAAEQLIILLPPRSSRSLARRCLRWGTTRWHHKLSETEALKLERLPDLESLWHMVPPESIICYFERLHRVLRALLFLITCFFIWGVALHLRASLSASAGFFLLGSALYWLARRDESTAKQVVLSLNEAWLARTSGHADS